VKYEELRKAKLSDLFSAEELFEFVDLMDIELRKMDLIEPHDDNTRKALRERIISFKCLKEDLRVMAGFLISDHSVRGLRRKNKIVA